MPVSEQASHSPLLCRNERRKASRKNSWEAAETPSTTDSHFRWVLALYVCVCVCEHSAISCVHGINIRGGEDLCVNEWKALVTEETFFFLLKGKPQL